jgi:hypothetical protein
VPDLGKLTSAGLLAVEAHGGYRCYRLAAPEVGELLEMLQQQALRTARTCDDHVGRLRVETPTASTGRVTAASPVGEQTRPGALSI